MEVKTAVSLGHLRKTPEGYADAAGTDTAGATAGTQRSAQRSAQQDTEGSTEAAPEDVVTDATDGPVAFPDEVEQEIGTFASAVPPQLQDRVIASVIESGTVALDISQAAGMDHGVMAAGIEHARNAFQAQARHQRP
jgi:hypothetical protein